MIKFLLEIFTCASFLTRCQSKFEGFIVNGELTTIHDFPHSAYLEAYCIKQRVAMCGSSILNQWFLITAAHCLPPDDCAGRQLIRIKYGHENKKLGVDTRTETFLSHPQYNTSRLAYDIALVMLEAPMKLSTNVSRIAISRKPVRSGQSATIAGWGYIQDDEDPKVTTMMLKYTYQTIMEREDCQDELGRLPPGVICSLDANWTSRPSGGDSGSALVVDNYKQVGIVSYRQTNEKRIIVYTDIAHYYNWIVRTVNDMFCSSEISR